MARSCATSRLRIAIDAAPGSAQQCPHRPTKKSPASEATRAGQGPRWFGARTHCRLRPHWPSPRTLEVRATRQHPGALSLEPIGRPRLYQIDHNARFSWWWPTIQSLHEPSLMSKSLHEQSHPRTLADTDSNAVTPISPAAQKFHRLILCSLTDSSVTLANSSLPGLRLGRCHIADANQHMAEPHPVIRTAVSMNDRILHL